MAEEEVKKNTKVTKEETEKKVKEGSTPDAVHRRAAKSATKEAR